MAERDRHTGGSPVDPGAIRKYGELKGRILSSIEAMRVLGVLRGEAAEALHEKIATDTFNLLVVGQFKRGKTCLINALLGADLLPVAVVPLTSIVTILTFGETVTVRVHFTNGSEADIAPEQLADYVTEAANPKNVKEVAEVVVTYPSAYLKDGVRLIDTPGVGSVYLHNTDVAYQYLPKSDAALFLLSVEQPVSRAELDFLKDVQQYADRIFFLLNKIDYLSEEEVRESIAFSRRALTEVMGGEVKVFPISAKLALSGTLQSAPELSARSRLPEFSETLHGFLLREKGRVLLTSATGTLLRELAQARLECELEGKSLTTPLSELKEKIAAFEDKKADILLERQSLEALLTDETGRIVKAALDPDLAAFKAELGDRLPQAFDAFYETQKELALKELNDALEGFVKQEIESAFSAWRTGEEQKIAAAFEAIARRFRGRINDWVDALLRYSSELFAIHFETVADTTGWTSESSFHFKLTGDPVGLDMLESSLTQVLPRYISNRFQRFKDYIFRKANERIYAKQRARLLELSDIQAGRLRHDFTERLKRSKEALRREMLARIDTAAAGISEAIDKGMRLRASGEQAAAARQEELGERMERLDALRSDLLFVRHCAESL